MYDAAEIDNFIQCLYDARQAGGLTEARVTAFRQEARDLTQGAVDDPARLDGKLRHLLRVLFTLAYDAGLWPLAQTLLDLACPPALRDPPLAERSSASDKERILERIKWRNAQGMLLENIDQWNESLSVFMRNGEDYLALDPPDAENFAVLTNAVQSAYELGDYTIGESLLARAEEMAKNWHSDMVQWNLALARLYPPLPDCDLETFRKRHAEALDLAARIAPASIPQVNRFVVLSCLQMDMPEAAVEWLDPPPPDTAPVKELVEDTLARLQLKTRLEQADMALVMRALRVLGHGASRPHDGALKAALALALFALGQSGSAVLMATLFIRNLEIMIVTLPRNPQKARQRRASILNVLKPLQATLVMAGYLRAAEEIAGIEAILTYSRALSVGKYRDWTPGPEVTQAAAKLVESIEAARKGKASAEAIEAQVMAFDLVQAAPMRTSHVEGRLNLAFLPEGNGLALIVHAPDGARKIPIALAPMELTDLIQKLHRALQSGEAEDERAALGEALLGPVASEIAAANELHIAPFGPVAGLAFACLAFEGKPLGQDRRLTIRTCVAPRAGKASTATTGLKVLFASGGEDDRLEHARDEAHAVIALHDAQEGALVGEFDQVALVAALAQAPEILHIAAHFKRSKDNSGSGYLVGAGGVAIPLSEIFTPDTDLTATRLVFLSGCDSAGHGGSQSLAGQLNMLGAHHVMASLWPVDDDAAAEMAQLIHRGLVAGLAPDVALFEAMGALRAQPRFNHPRHWAAFQCYAA